MQTQARCPSGSRGATTDETPPRSFCRPRGGITLVGAPVRPRRRRRRARCRSRRSPGCRSPSAATSSASRSRGARRAQRRREGERLRVTRRPRRPARAQRAPLRRRPRDRREREHDGRAGGGGPRGGSHVPLAPNRDGGDRDRRLQRRDLGAQRPDPRRQVARRTLGTQPELAYGTRIYDAVTRSLALLRDAKLSSGSIVLLSDGADIGSLRSLDQAVAAAKEQQVRVFTVGLRSGAYDPAPLQAIAERTGGAYAEARSAAELAAVYEALGTQLAGEYLVRYRSAARPMSQVDVRIEVAGEGEASTALRRADAVAPRALPPLGDLDVSALGQLAARARALPRAARVRAVARCSRGDRGRRWSIASQSFSNGRAGARRRAQRRSRCGPRPATDTPPAGGRSSNVISSSRG